jgi:AraC family transcriptional regulator of adaptative response/methylated-DNA-[protein]-cysteine methyltransferase
MTPGEFKKQGAGLQILYGFCDSPFGECLLAITQRGICYFGFVDSGERSETFSQLRDTWPGSEFIENPTTIRPIVNDIFSMGSIYKSKLSVTVFVTLMV